MLFLSLHGDDSGLPGAELAHGDVFWPLTPAPALIHANPGFEIGARLLQTDEFLLVAVTPLGEDQTFDATRRDCVALC
jgi:hypothetical protein